MRTPPPAPAAILVDTGALYALADESDTWHQPVRHFLEDHTVSLIAPVTVLPETCYLLNAYLGPEAERRLVAACTRGELAVEAVTLADLRRSLELLEQYADANIGFVDASVVAVAERLQIRRLLTTDRRDFALIRPRHCRAFELLP